MAHPSWPWQDEAFAVARHKTNVFLELSGWSPRLFSPELVEAVRGPLADRTLFGSDYPFITPDKWLSDWEQLDMPERCDTGRAPRQRCPAFGWMRSSRGAPRHPMLFSLEEARALLPEARVRAGRIAAGLAEVRAGTDRLAEVAGGNGHDPATLDDTLSVRADLEWFRRQGIEIKGFEPLLIDFPHRVGDRVVLLCWQYGEDDLGWWHDIDTGYAGRRPLSELG